jgi:hypothetical protein
LEPVDEKCEEKAVKLFLKVEKEWTRARNEAPTS